MTALGARKAILMNMQMMNSRSRIEFRMPSRGLFGYRSQFLTDTHGEGIMNTIFDGYEEWCGDIQTRPPAPSSALIPATPSPTACSTPSSAAP